MHCLSHRCVSGITTATGVGTTTETDTRVGTGAEINAPCLLGHTHRTLWRSFMLLAPWAGANDVNQGWHPFALPASWPHVKLPPTHHPLVQTVCRWCRGSQLLLVLEVVSHLQIYPLR